MQSFSLFSWKRLEIISQVVFQICDVNLIVLGYVDSL